VTKSWRIVLVISVICSSGEFM